MGIENIKPFNGTETTSCNGTVSKIEQYLEGVMTRQFEIIGNAVRDENGTVREFPTYRAALDWMLKETV
jgi:hypothetical protein